MATPIPAPGEARCSPRDPTADRPKSAPGRGAEPAWMRRIGLDEPTWKRMLSSLHEPVPGPEPKR